MNYTYYKPLSLLVLTVLFCLLNGISGFCQIGSFAKKTQWITTFSIKSNEAVQINPPRKNILTPKATSNFSVGIKGRRQYQKYYYDFGIGTETVKAKFNLNTYYVDENQEKKDFQYKNAGTDPIPALFFSLNIGRSVLAFPDKNRRLNVSLGLKISTLIFNAGFSNSFGISLQSQNGEITSENLFVVEYDTQWKPIASPQINLSTSKISNPKWIYSATLSLSGSPIINGKYAVTHGTDNFSGKFKINDTFIGLGIGYMIN